MSSLVSISKYQAGQIYRPISKTAPPHPCYHKRYHHSPLQQHYCPKLHPVSTRSCIRVQILQQAKQSQKALWRRHTPFRSFNLLVCRNHSMNTYWNAPLFATWKGFEHWSLHNNKYKNDDRRVNIDKTNRCVPIRQSYKYGKTWKAKKQQIRVPRSQTRKGSDNDNLSLDPCIKLWRIKTQKTNHMIAGFPPRL